MQSSAIECNRYYGLPASVERYARAIDDVGLWESEQRVLAEFAPVSGAILDLGCGAGRTSFALHRLGYSTLRALDFSPALIVAAQEYGHRHGIPVPFEVGSATSLPFPHESFSTVFFSYNGLMCIPGRNARRRALQEIWRVLRPGGRLIFTAQERTAFPDYEKFFATLPAPKEHGDYWIVDGDDGTTRTYVHLATEEEMRRTVVSCGFKTLLIQERDKLAEESEAVRAFSGNTVFWVVEKDRAICEALCHVLDAAPTLAREFEAHRSDSFLTYCNDGILATTESDGKEAVATLSDLVRATEAYVAARLGVDTASRVASSLAASPQPLLLSANHHGVDFCAQAIQGNLLVYSLLKTKNYKLKTSSFPIFACTTIHLGNSNFPRGMLLYDNEAGKPNVIIKIPVYPLSERNAMVGRVRPMTEAMVRTALDALRKERRQGTISDPIYRTAAEIFEGDYLRGDVLGAESYAHQATLLNHRLGRRMVRGDEADFVYVEIEEIAARLLGEALGRSDSLECRLLFDVELRTALLEELEGVRGCFSTPTLHRMTQERMVDSVKAARGTHFFWGVDASAKRYPLALVADTLFGVDMSGHCHAFEFTAGAVRQGLERRDLYPGLFLTFLQFAMLRGAVMLGGCFQGEYLRRMSEGLGRALARVGDSRRESVVAPPGRYVSGPMFLMGEGRAGAFPKGPVELIRDGGVTLEELREAMSLSFEHAHVYGLCGFREDGMAHSVLT